MFKKFFVLMALVTLSLPALADECCPDDPDFDGANCTLNGGTILPTGCGGGGPAATVPIDGGASIFAGIATIYGVRRLRKKRKK